MSSSTVTRPPQPARPDSADTGTDSPVRFGRLPRRWKRVLVLILVSAVLATAGWLVLFSTVFAAKQVRVSGLQDLEAKQVVTAADVLMGQPLARQDLQAIGERAVLIPQIQQVHVRRAWPNTITIAVVERRPLLAMPQDSGFLIIDRRGVAYETRPALPKNVMLVQTDPANTLLLAELGAAAGVMPKSLRNQVTTVMANTGDDITLVLRSGVTVMWGDASASELKSDLTLALLKRKHTVSIDVSSPHNPAVR